MRQRLRSHLTYPNVMVTILAFIVLGGGAYAAFRLPAGAFPLATRLGKDLRSRRTEAVLPS